MDWQGVAYGLACCLIHEIQRLFAYGLACCLIHEIKHLVSYGLARRCVWIGMLFDAQNISILVAYGLARRLRVDWHAV